MANIKSSKRAFSSELRLCLGDRNALNWYYQKTLPDLECKTPHEYVVFRGDDGRRIIASELHDLLNDQSS